MASKLSPLIFLALFGLLAANLEGMIACGDFNASWRMNIGCDKCQQRLQNLPCALPPRRSCVCDDGFGRGRDGKCISMADCFQEGLPRR
ncbi:unnamed protein product, partial [Mesorhabditis spiculigera]